MAGRSSMARRLRGFNRHPGAERTAAAVWYHAGPLRSDVMKSALVAALCLVAGPSFAARPTREFKAAFEQTFRPKQTYAVVVQAGVPTTSVYGVDGKSSSTAHYSIDVVDGKWKTSQGL